MTKTLTEQWREGTLENGRYYVKDWDGTIYRFVAQNKILWRDSNNPIYASERIEVLAPVPSYDEYNELVQKMHILEKRLEIAIKALEEIPDLLGNDDDYGALCCATDALQEMEGVK